ncbi:hypothetical protein CDD83_8280 [Cordyceps sp. RAO-2017]|nr:hypothetical protein CDD83_8280 [Cordyceps sp. RAO-2017]
MRLNPVVRECVLTDSSGFIEDVDESSADYDYIIVGSGAGGSPLAARLATYGHRVLLIDAGDDQTKSYEYRVPAMSLKSSEYVPMSWNFFVNHYPDLERQRRDSKMTWRTRSGKDYVGLDPPPGSTPKGVLYPRAGTLGGCTAHNAMITSYPNDADWDDIAQLTGDDSWAAPKMRKIFQRIERCRYFPALPRGHGYTGWLTTSVTSLKFTLQDIKLGAMVLAAASAAGQGIGKLMLDARGLAQVAFRDLNAAVKGRDQREGIFQMPLAIKDGARSGPVDFIQQVLAAQNRDGSPKYHLDILLTTLVTRINFDHGGKDGRPRAVGVEFARGRSLYRADPRASYGQRLPHKRNIRARREVIVAAGTFNTPQLLKLSGIGPKAELRRWGIPVVVDSPGVGTNMQDRYETTVVSNSPKNFSLTEQCRFATSESDPCMHDWKYEDSISNRGAYTTSGIALAVLKKSSVTVHDRPDLFMAGIVADFKGYFPSYADKATSTANHWTWIILKAHTRNRAGTVHLRSRDPRDTPLINFNYFDSGTNDNGEADLDAQALVEGLDWARKATENINHAPIFTKYTEVWPGNQVKGRADMKDWVKREAWGHHASCTCPMGADSDRSAPLDSKFRVRGVDNLRVVDASAFPRIPGYFIVTSVYMISEKAADVIHADSQAPHNGYGSGPVWTVDEASSQRSGGFRASGGSRGAGGFQGSAGPRGSGGFQGSGGVQFN